MVLDELCEKDQIWAMGFSVRSKDHDNCYVYLYICIFVHLKTMIWYFSEEISQRSKCRAERMGNVGPENQISLEDRVCISFVSFYFTFYSNFWNALLLFSPKWCSGRLAGVMLDKPAFVAPPQIGFVWQSNLISSLTRATQFRSIESNSLWPVFVDLRLMKNLMSVMFETKINDPFKNDENDAKKRCQITRRQITPNCLGQKKLSAASNLCI